MSTPTPPAVPARPAGPALAPQTGPVMPPQAGPAMPPQTAPAPTRPGGAAPARPGAPAAPVVSAGPVAAPAASSDAVRIEVAQTESLDIAYLLTYLVKSGGSDLHLSIRATPMVRILGEMTAVPGQPVISRDLMEQGLRSLVTDDQWEKFQRDKELDFAYTLEGVARFRGNLMKQQGAPGAVFRLIPWEIKPLEALGIPNVVNNFTSLPRGLVLVTGPTGSGKSTTLAAMVDRANRTRSGHIITVEDPIEFLHAHRGCIVNQREVGSDTDSFADALKHVLRQDPDIILVGEMRDLETISIAITAAETGHLVFGTLHTQSAQDTVNRIIDVFPPEQQQQIRTQLSATLKGVVCQSLVKTQDTRGRVPAVEIMIVNSAIAAMIRRGETHQIPQALQSGAGLGMQTLNQCLAELVRTAKITKEAALDLAHDTIELETLLNGVSVATAYSTTGGGMGSLPMGMDGLPGSSI